MIGDHHDQCVIQNPELLQLAGELLQAPIVVQDLAVVAINGLVDELSGLTPLFVQPARLTTTPPPYFTLPPTLL